MDSETDNSNELTFTEDIEAESKSDLGIPIDVKPDINDIFSSNLDTPEPPNSSNDNDLDHCVNCGTNFSKCRKRSLKRADILSVFQKWIVPPQVVTENSLVCLSCWKLAFNSSSKHENHQPKPNGSHRKYCVNCRCSLYRARSHVLHKNTEREANISNVISKWIEREVHGSEYICHACWMRADRANLKLAKLASKVDELPVTSGPIYLPDYIRAPDTNSKCFWPDCENPERLRVPSWLRLKLFANLKFYVSKNCRICSFHLENDIWDELLVNITKPNHKFSIEQIQDFASFAKEKLHTIDFENIDEMPEDFLNYWIGLSKEQFKQLSEAHPQLLDMKKGKLALIIYLIRRTTGDSLNRLSTLVNMSKASVHRLLTKAREALGENFNINNLGNHQK